MTAKAPVVEMGNKVVDIGDVRVSRGRTRRPATTCNHKSVTYDSTERRVWCQDCETELDHFEAFMLLVNQWDVCMRKHDRRESEIKSAEAHTLRRRAAKKMDAAWQSRSMVPCCPHCNEALLPDDVMGRLNMASKEWVIASRKRQEKNQ